MAARLLAGTTALHAWPEDQVWVYLELGILDCEIGQHEEGVKLRELALDIAKARTLTTVVDAAHVNLARAERELGHVDAAEAHMRAVAPEQRGFGVSPAVLRARWPAAPGRGTRDGAARAAAVKTS